MSTLNAIKSSFDHMMNRILHSWLFHMKFIKLAEGSFDKLNSYEMTSREISFMYQAVPLFFLIEATFVPSKILLGRNILSKKRRGYFEH